MSTRRLIRLAPLACLVAFVHLGCESRPRQMDRYLDVQSVPECDPTVSVAADSNALLVTDPESLAELSLEVVLRRLLDEAQDPLTTPTMLLNRMFDQNNDDAGGVFDDVGHCDSPLNIAHDNGPAALCPRAEGVLATSKGFFTPGDPDHFFPVAVVNRFDLTPTFASSCGEYRIIYAKESGLADPDNRVFLIFEASLPNPDVGNLLGCRAAAEVWRDIGAEPSAKVRAEMLRSFFFEGIPGAAPPITLSNLGNSFGGSGAGYYGGTGQVRLTQHMDADWEARELTMTIRNTGTLDIVQRVVGSNPLPAVFEPGVNDENDYWREDFRYQFVTGALPTLAARRIEHVGMIVGAQYLSGESAFGGDAINDYAARVPPESRLFASIEETLANGDYNADCPTDDPLTPDAVLRRATMMSCAGCHAPSKFLGPERKIGCGLTWPDSLGNVHIDETGKRSPALQEVFLPHRAEVFTTYLQACNAEEIAANVGGPFGSGAQAKSASSRRTLGGSTTH